MLAQEENKWAIEWESGALKGVERIEEDGPFLLTKMIFFF